MLERREPPTVARWPGLLRLRPVAAAGAAVSILVCVWTGVVAVDILNVAQPPRPAWAVLFNNSIVEWMQYLFEALAVVASAYLAGRLAASHRPRAAAFFLLIGISIALMLLEDASDARLHMARFFYTVFGDDGRLFGQHPHLYGTVLILAPIAFFPLYALARYGKDAWQAPTLRKYLAGTFLFYGVSQTMSFLSHQGGFYTRFGGWLNEAVFGGALPVDPDIGPALSSYLLVDSAIEESLEMLGIGCMLAMIVAYAADFRAGRLADTEDSALVLDPAGR